MSPDKMIPIWKGLLFIESVQIASQNDRLDARPSSEKNLCDPLSYRGGQCLSENAAEEENLVLPTSSSESAKFHKHFRRVLLIAITKFDYIVFVAFESRLPIRLSISILDALGSCSDLR